MGERYVKRYHTGPVLSGRFCHSQTGPKGKIVQYNDLYYFPVLFQGSRGASDSDGVSCRRDQGLESTVPVYGKRTQGDSGADADHGCV